MLSVPHTMPVKFTTPVLPVHWAERVAEAQNQAAALAMGVFSASGGLIWSNRGMQIALHVGDAHFAPCDYFVNPTFRQLAALQASADAVFEGLITLGNPHDAGVSLIGRVYRQPSELLVVCEYDVLGTCPRQRPVCGNES